MDVEGKDKRKKMVAPVVTVVFFILLFLSITGFLWWAKFTYTEDSPPMFFMFLFTALLLAPSIGLIFALRTRMKEIQGGEEDAVSKY